MPEDQKDSRFENLTKWFSETKDKIHAKISEKGFIKKIGKKMEKITKDCKEKTLTEIVAELGSSEDNPDSDTLHGLLNKLFNLQSVTTRKTAVGVINSIWHSLARNDMIVNNVDYKNATTPPDTYKACCKNMLKVVKVKSNWLDKLSVLSDKKWVHNDKRTLSFTISSWTSAVRDKAKKLREALLDLNNKNIKTIGDLEIAWGSKLNAVDWGNFPNNDPDGTTHATPVSMNAIVKKTEDSDKVFKLERESKLAAVLWEGSLKSITTDKDTYKPEHAEGRFKLTPTT